MTSKDVIQDVMDDLAEQIKNENIVHRDLVGPLSKSISMEEVTVLKGVRRSGKTFMLYELWKKFGGVYVNFEDDRLMDFSVDDFQKVLDIAKISGEKILYLDEVQEVIGWEKFAHRIHRRMKVFVTGSNSKLLSSDYSRGLVGRTKSYESHTLSYNEFLRFKDLENNRSSLLDYMSTGGFPRVVLSGDRSLVKEYLDRMLYRDIIANNGIRYPEALKSIAYYMLSNIGKEFSYRSLKEISGLSHESTIREYIGLLKNAYLLKVINAYSGSLKKQERYSKKVYTSDQSLARLGKRKEPDNGRVLENVVFNHLDPEGDLFFFKDTNEVDFLLCDGLKPIRGVNSTFEADEERTLSREIRGLEMVRERYDIPVDLVSVYPVGSLPEGITNRLANRYLVEDM